MVALVAVLLVSRSRDDLAEAPEQPAWALCETEQVAEVESTEGPAVEVALEPIAEVESPTAMAEAPDGTLYVSARLGQIWAVRDGETSEEPVIDLSDQVTAEGERGVGGIAIDPEGQHLYVQHTDLEGDSNLVEFTITDGVVDPDSTRVVWHVDQDYQGHLGGQLAFGPDGYLYAGYGDGGDVRDVGDPNLRGQDLSNVQGSIARIDPAPDGDAPHTVPADNPFVDDPAAVPEIYAFGFRNPWRFSFDSATRDLWVGDVGHFCWEEVDHLPAGEAAGANLGWRSYEGLHRFLDEPIPDAVLPVYEYEHQREGDELRCAIVGGYVYHGTSIPALDGGYVFGDLCSGRVQALFDVGDGTVARSTLLTGVTGLQSFGEDSEGELYVLSADGVSKIVPAPASS